MAHRYATIACAMALGLATLAIVIAIYGAVLGQGAKMELEARRERVNKIEAIELRVETLEAEQEARWQKLLSTQSTDNKQP